MKIFIDFDSTLVDFTTGWIKWLKKEKFIKITPSDILHWDWISNQYGDHVNEYWRTEGIYDTIYPIPGAAEFLVALKKLYGKDNVILISNSARNMIEEKEKYANKYFLINPNNFLHAYKKWEMTSDGILVDDAPHNVEDHIRENRMPGILFNYRNRYGWGHSIHENDPRFEPFLKKCSSYSQCLEEIEKFRKRFKLDEKDN